MVRFACTFNDVWRAAGRTGHGGVIGARSGHHHRLSRGTIDHPTNDLLTLIGGHGRGLTRGADRDDAVGAFGDVPLDQAPERVVIERAILAHRRDDRHQ